MHRFELYALTRNFEVKRNDYFANSYIQVLDDNLLEIYEPNLIFMQNNASIHTVKKVKKWFEENDITIMSWPPYSPNLNLIKHL